MLLSKQKKKKTSDKVKQDQWLEVSIPTLTLGCFCVLADLLRYVEMESTSSTLPWR